MALAPKKKKSEKKKKKKKKTIQHNFMCSCAVKSVSAPPGLLIEWKAESLVAAA